MADRTLNISLLRRLKISILCISILISCILTLNSSASEQYLQSGIDIDTLLSSSEQVKINGSKFVLEVYLWRDFMPISPPGGQPLIASIGVASVDSSDFPSFIDADRLWVIKDKEVWETKFSEEERPYIPGQLQKIARNGPKWDPNIYIDVVVRLIDRESKKTYLLKALKQLIEATY